MSSFLKGVGKIFTHPIDEAKWILQETKNVGKPLLKGDFSEAGKAFGHTFGNHNSMMADNITIPMFGNNKLSKNPDAVAGAIIGSIFAAPAMAGASGGTSGGTAGQAANVGWSGGAKLGLGNAAYTPTTTFGQTAGGVQSGAAYTPTTTFGQLASTGVGQSGGTIAGSGLSAPQAASQATTQSQIQDLVKQQMGGQQDNQREQEEQRRLQEQERLRQFMQSQSRMPQQLGVQNRASLSDAARMRLESLRGQI